MGQLALPRSFPPSVLLSLSHHFLAVLALLPQGPFGGAFLTPAPGSQRAKVAHCSILSFSVLDCTEVTACPLHVPGHLRSSRGACGAPSEGAPPSVSCLYVCSGAGARWIIGCGPIHWPAEWHLSPAAFLAACDPASKPLFLARLALWAALSMALWAAPQSPSLNPAFRHQGSLGSGSSGLTAPAQGVCSQLEMHFLVQASLFTLLQGVHQLVL